MFNSKVLTKAKPWDAALKYGRLPAAAPPDTTEQKCEQCFGARYTSDGLPCTACNAMGESTQGKEGNDGK